MRTISIKQSFADDHISRAAGERLRLMLEAAHRAGETIELDFTGLKVGSTSFFDEGLAKLNDAGWDRQRLEQVVQFKGLYHGDRKILETVCTLRGLFKS